MAKGGVGGLEKVSELEALGGPGEVEGLEGVHMKLWKVVDLGSRLTKGIRRTRLTALR